VAGDLWARCYAQAGRGSVVQNVNWGLRAMKWYGVLAVAVLAVHVVWILWVILGWPVCRNRPGWRWFHFVSLIYGIVIEIVPWPCPLTLLEQWLEGRAGITPYKEPFLVHYLEAFVYPDVPAGLLIGCAVAVCGANLYLHLRRLRREFVRKGGS
jgi:Protein of Unknown function (DUF2784)